MPQPTPATPAASSPGPAQTETGPAGTTEADGPVGPPAAATDSPRVAESSPDHGSLRKSLRDIALSMGVIAVIIAVAMIITWRQQPDPVRPVDALPVAQAVAGVAEFPVLYPQVAAGWRPTSARFEPTEKSGDAPVWFNGWVTPDDEYVAVVQSTATSQQFVTEQTIDGRPARALGPQTPIPGWTAYVSRDGEQRSLVRQTSRSTTIVTGTTDWNGLMNFLRTLAPMTPTGPGTASPR